MSSRLGGRAVLAAPSWRTLTLALIAGFVGMVVSVVLPVIELDLEERIGLIWLYSLRGERPPPDSVVLVGLSSDAADQLGISVDVDEWPRHYHAQIIDRLNRAGAETIVFDLAFEVAGDAADDAALVRAIDSAGNVVVLERTEERDLALPGLEAPAYRLQRIPLIPEVDAAALATAPFTLPRHRLRINQFWVFGNGTNDTPSLPTVALQAFLIEQYDDLIVALETGGIDTGDLPASSAALADADFEVAMRAVRRLFLDDPTLGSALLAGLGARSRRDAGPRALVEAYAGPVYRYLNYYGPSGTIPTIPYHELLGPGAGEHNALIDGRAVFVGYSERLPSEQQDEFVSVFSGRSGISLGGVEIGATAFANLLAGDSIRAMPVVGQLAWVFVLGLGLAGLLAHLRIRFALPVGVVLGAVYLGFGVYAFDARYLWLPLVVPLGVQLPFVLAAITLLRYRDVNLQRERVQQALGRYMPPVLIGKLARDAFEATGSGHELLHGTCLVTDVERYTELAERLPAAELAALMQDYFRALHGVVEAHGGYVVDTAGDSMVALWAAGRADPALQRRAVAAAVAIGNELDRFNAGRPDRMMPTAVGLESGEVAVGRIGPRQQDEYRVVGDIVNTAARIESLNRHLGTRILTSTAALSDVPGCGFRRVGWFRVAGKQSAVEVYECLSSADARGAQVLASRERFAEGLSLFAAREFRRASAAFEAVIGMAGGSDGPSSFYLQQCRDLEAATPGPDWSGTIVLDRK